MFIDHFPLVFHVGILEHDTVERVVIVITLLFGTPGTAYFGDAGASLSFWRRVLTEVWRLT